MFRDPIWNELRRMQNEMDSMFDNFFGRQSDQKLLGDSKNRNELTKSEYRRPFGDTYETESEVITTLEIPGAKKEDIQINASDNNLEVKVEHKQEKKEKDRYMQSYSGFYRCLSLPASIDPNKIKASYKDGVLKLQMPKKTNEKKRQIQID